MHTSEYILYIPGGIMGVESDFCFVPCGPNKHSIWLLASQCKEVFYTMVLSSAFTCSFSCLFTKPVPLWLACYNNRTFCGSLLWRPIFRGKGFRRDEEIWEGEFISFSRFNPKVMDYFNRSLINHAGNQAPCMIHLRTLHNR